MLEADLGQTGECPSDVQDWEGHQSSWPGRIEVKAQPQGQGRKPTDETEKMETPSAAGGIHDQEALCTRAEYQEKSQIERPSILEMRTYVLSRVFADSPSRRGQSSTDCTLNPRSHGLDQPNLIRCRSWLDAQVPDHPSVSARRPQSRRWSMWMPDRRGPQHPAGETEAWAPEVNVTVLERWCEEYHETKVAEWQQADEEFGQAWKRWCFAQRQAYFWQDYHVKQVIKHFWQPLSDFNYVLSVYSFLEGVGNCNLLPHLRPAYMAWRSPEQIRSHEGCDLRGEEDWPIKNGTPSHDTSRDNGSRAAASKYPLTRRQHLRLARICGDMGWMLKDLRYWLDMFQTYRGVCTMVNMRAGIPYAVQAEHRRRLDIAAKQFLSRSKMLISQLRDSRTGLCEALGLDPNRVPGGDPDSPPTMTVTNCQKTADIPPPCQGGLALSRGFGLRKATLQASRIALKANLYITLLPCDIAQRLLGRMMARSTEMATTAREAGDHKAEATMRRLHNKLRKVSDRAGQEFPSLKRGMTLLDSETWPAVLNPREDMQLEIHGDISLPVETLIDMLHAQQVPASIPEPTPDGAGNLSTSGSVTMAPEKSPGAEQAVENQASSTSNSTSFAEEAEAHNA